MTIPLRRAQADDLRAIGIEPTEPAEQPARILEGIDRFRRFSRALSVMLETCTGCGACAQACHSYLGTQDPRNIPAARADVLRAVYQRHFTWSGRLRGRLPGAAELDQDGIQEWVDAFYQCNACRRCAQACPFGIDTGEITLAARNILARAGIASQFMVGIAKNELTIGNNSGVRQPAMLDICGFLEEELSEETGLDVEIPVDRPGSEILFVPSSSEFFVNSDTLVGAAKMFHALGASWTLSSSIAEAANYGFMFDIDVLKRHNQRLRAAAAAVGATTVIMGECGHGWRVAKMCSEGANGPFPFRLTHVLEYAAAHLPELQLRRLPLRATLHDPCNYGRGAGLLDPPRELMRACVEDFVEMSPHRERNYCCGGGAGMLMDEMTDLRAQFGMMKAEQIRALLPLDYIALPCASCKAQVPMLLERHGLRDASPGIRTGGILDLLGQALVMTGSGQPPHRTPA